VPSDPPAALDAAPPPAVARLLRLLPPSAGAAAAAAAAPVLPAAPARWLCGPYSHAVAVASRTAAASDAACVAAVVARRAAMRAAVSSATARKKSAWVLRPRRASVTARPEMRSKQRPVAAAQCSRAAAISSVRAASTCGDQSRTGKGRRKEEEGRWEHRVYRRDGISVIPRPQQPTPWERQRCRHMLCKRYHTGASP